MHAPVTPAGALQINSPGENLATSSPTRVFPDMAQILANNTNAIDGTCPAMPPKPTTPGTPVPLPAVPVTECFAEWLPTADYVGSPANPGVGWAGNTEPSLNFRFTARDLAPEGGGYAYGDVKLLLDKTSGPFRVTSKARHHRRGGGRSHGDHLLDQQHERPLGQREDQPVDGRRTDLPDGPRREHAQRRQRPGDLARRGHHQGADQGRGGGELLLRRERRRHHDPVRQRRQHPRPDADHAADHPADHPADAPPRRRPPRRPTRSARGSRPRWSSRSR